MAREGWVSWAAVAAGMACLVATLGFATAGAQGYWENPFLAVPAWTWVAWLSSVALAWTTLLASQRPLHHGVAAALLLASVLQLVLLPRSKGMVASDAGDPITHAGYVVDLLRDGTFRENLYPGLHLWGGAHSLLLDLHPLAILETLFGPVMLAGFCLGCGLLGQLATRQPESSQAFAVGVGLGALPIGFFLRSWPASNHWTFLLLPLAIAAVAKSFDPQAQHRSEWIVLACVLFLVLALGHPLMAPVLLLVVAAATVVALLGRHPDWRGQRWRLALAAVTLLVVNILATAFLVFGTEIGQRLLEQAESEPRPPVLDGGDGGGRTPVGSTLDRAEDLGFDWLDVLRYVAVNYMPLGIVVLVAGAGIAVLALRGGPTPARRLALAIGIAGVVLLLVGASSQVVGDLGIRSGRFLQYAFPLLVAAAAGAMLRGRQTAPLTALLVVAMVVASGAGLAGAYRAPPSVQAWDAVPQSEVVGASWYITYKVDKPVFIGPASAAHRLGTMVFGPSGVREARPDLYEYTPFGVQWRSNFPKVPDHFDFARIDYVCGSPSTGRTALVYLPVGDLEPYLEGTYRVVERFEPADLGRWTSPSGGALVYDSGPRQVQIYTTPPGC